MQKQHKRKWLACMTAMALGAMTLGPMALAADTAWPSKPIRLLVAGPAE